MKTTCSASPRTAKFVDYLRTSLTKEVYMRLCRLSRKEENNPVEPLNSTQDFKSIDKKVLGFLLKDIAKNGYCSAPQSVIASELECCPRTVASALKRLKDALVIYVLHRFNNSNFTYLNPFILQNWDWYTAFCKIFSYMPAPKIILGIGMLLSTNCNLAVASLKRTIRSTSCNLSKDKDLVLSLKQQQESLSKAPNGQVEKKVSGSMSDRFKDGQMDPELYKKVRGIALALNRRGANLSNDDALGLLAFDKVALDKASKAFKDAPKSSMQSVQGYFFGLCHRFQKELGKQKDAALVGYVSRCCLRILNENEEYLKLKVDEPEKVKSEDSPKREQSKVSYTEQVKKGIAEEKAKAEARKPHVDSVAAELEFAESQIAAYKAQPAMNDFQRAAMKGLENRVEYLRSLAAESGQISNTAKDVTLVDGTTPEGVQKVNPVADLNIISHTGETYDDEVPGSGECSTDAQTSFIPGAPLR